ncbi:MAG: hypothetical protein ACFFEV_01155 [Candidatus Thorarchaeota archaeon]
MVLEKQSSPNDFDSDCYYIDEGCQTLERIIRTRTEFSNCRVKRLSQVEVIGGDPPASEDPFALISSEKTLMAWVYPWELEALSNPENLLAYLIVETERTKIAEATDPSILVLSLLSILIGPVLGTSLYFLLGPFQNPLYFGVFLVIVATSICVIFSLYRKVTKKRNLLTDLDIRYARETTEFREALRTLASLSTDYEIFDTLKYAKRYKIIEDVLLSDS